MKVNRRLGIFFAVILIILSIISAAHATDDSKAGGMGSARSQKNETNVSWGSVPAPATSTSDPVPGARVTVNLLSRSGTSVTYIIDPSAGIKGKILPSKKQKLSAGDNITFSIIPDAGFTIAEVLVDGNRVNTVSAYTFNSVNANHTLSATFKKGIVENQKLVSGFSTRFNGSGMVVGANITTFYWDGKGQVYLTGGNGYLNTYADDAFDVYVDGRSLSFSRSDHTIYRGIPELTSICHKGVNNLTLNIRDIYGSPVGCGETWLWFDQKLNANFTGTPVTGSAPLIVNFTDTSTGPSPASWKWDFGDGKSSKQQNPSHTYTSAGTYTVNLTVKNADGNDTEVKGGYVKVMKQALHQAINVLSVKSGDSEYTNDAILNTATIQAAMNYDPLNIDGYALNVRETIRSHLSDDHIILINGHANAGMIQVNKQNDEIYFAKKFLPGEYEFNETASFENMDLAIFLGCNSGNSDMLHGNLVDVIGDKNGRCTMGWTKELNIVVAPYYNNQLWSQIQQSKTIIESHNAAIVSVASDGFCQQLHAERPEQYDEYCNQNSLYYRENIRGCHIKLSNGNVPVKKFQGIIQNSIDNVQSSPSMIAKSTESINRFTKYRVKNLHYVGNMKEFYADISAFDSDDSFYLVNNINNRVQSFSWNENSSKEQKEKIDLDQGYSIAESFARENYMEFWNITETRSVNVITKKTVDRGGDRELQYEWREMFHSHDKNNTSRLDIPGLNLISVTVSPYTGHVIRYLEISPPSVPTGVISVDLFPSITEEKAKIISENQLKGIGLTQSTELESLGLKIMRDNNNNPHLTWNFESRQTEKIGSKNQEFEYNVYAFVSVDAHDGTIVWSVPYG